MEMLKEDFAITFSILWIGAPAPLHLVKHLRLCCLAHARPRRLARRLLLALRAALRSIAAGSPPLGPVSRGAAALSQVRAVRRRGTACAGHRRAPRCSSAPPSPPRMLQQRSVERTRVCLLCSAWQLVTSRPTRTALPPRAGGSCVFMSVRAFVCVCSRARVSRESAPKAAPLLYPPLARPHRACGRALHDATEGARGTAVGQGAFFPQNVLLVGALGPHVPAAHSTHAF